MRDEVLAAAREMLALGLTAGTAGNVSGRDGDTVVVTPAGLDYRTMTADDLVVLDLAGAVVEGHREPSSERALHLAAYRAFPEVRGVVHAHPVHATMFACARRPVPAAVDEFAIYVGGDVRCADYAPSGTPQLGDNAAACLDTAGSALLASHGMLTVAGSPDEAVHQAVVVERSARILWGTRLLGGAVPLPGAAVDDLAAEYRRRRGR